MEFIESPPFSRRYREYLDEDGYRRLQNALAMNPAGGDVMPGTGGFRKIRWADPRRGKGRRGGLRVIYFHFPAESQIWLMTIYDKNEMADLSVAEKRVLRDAVDSETRRRKALREKKSREK
jgi:hypothetical protein